jgi:hypothetical protein
MRPTPSLAALPHHRATDHTGKSPDSVAADSSAVEQSIAPSGWSFGVMADTRWVGRDDGKNPNSVAADIINRINREFVAKGVKFVVQVGGISEDGSALGYATRATYAQALYNAGIGFYPLRGSRDAPRASEFQRVFPQTRNGRNNATPEDAFVSTNANADARPAPKAGSVFQVGAGFSSPSPKLQGLSYALDHQNARLVLLDSYPTPSLRSNPIAAQQPWIEQALASRPATGGPPKNTTYESLLAATAFDDRPPRWHARARAAKLRTANTAAPRTYGQLAQEDCVQP